jgi:hypothetical protein
MRPPLEHRAPTWIPHRLWLGQELVNPKSPEDLQPYALLEMFKRFTDRGRRVVVLAQEEARLLDHNYIGTEHLLGLIHEGEGVAAQVLGSLGISLPSARDQVEEIIGRGQAPPTGHIPFTPRAKKVLELSPHEAVQLRHNYIGTEHILLGLVRGGRGGAGAAESGGRSEHRPSEGDGTGGGGDDLRRSGSAGA